MVSDLNAFQVKMSDFVSFPLFGLTLVIKLRSFDIESHWNTLICFDKKEMVSDLNMSNGKMSDFVSFGSFHVKSSKPSNPPSQKWLKFGV